MPRTRRCFISLAATALRPSPTLFAAGALLVNRRGERFGDELDRPVWRVPDQPAKVACIVIDRSLATRSSAWPNFISTAPGIAHACLPDYRRNRPDVYTEAPTLQALGGKLGVPPAALER